MPILGFYHKTVLIAMVEQGCINISLCDILKCFDAVQALAHVAQYVESRTRAMKARLMFDSNSSHATMSYIL